MICATRALAVVALHEFLGIRVEVDLQVYPRARGIANQAHRFEPRRRWPTGSPCSAPATRIKGRRGVKLDLVLRFADGRKHLPTVELKRAA